MSGCCCVRSLRVLALALGCCSVASMVQAQEAKQTVPQNRIPDTDADHIKERNEWFFRGRLVHGMPSAELRRRAFQAKLQMRARHAAALATAHVTGQAGLTSGLWTPLGSHAIGLRCQRQWYAGLPPGLEVVREITRTDLLRDVFGIEAQEQVKTVLVRDEFVKGVVGDDLPEPKVISTGDTTAPPKRKRKIEEILQQFLQQLQESGFKVSKKMLEPLQESLLK